MSEYFISDLHLGHDNIIRFDGRPFSDAEEMERVIVTNWNSRVTKSDTVYILGDFCWKAQDNEWERLLDSLTGNKVLIQGNHDKETMSRSLRNRFADVKEYKEITCERKHVILCHYPILFYKSSYNPNCFMLCGHVHMTRENDFLERWRTELKSSRAQISDSCGNVYNVGCMLPYMNYTPRTLSEIIEANN